MSGLSMPLRPSPLKAGHPETPPSLPPVSSYSSLAPTLTLPSSAIIHLPHIQAGLRADVCADLVIHIRATLSAQGPSLSASSHLSRSLSLTLSLSLPGPDLSCCHPPPAAREDLIKQHPSHPLLPIPTLSFKSCFVREQRNRLQ